MAFTRVTSLSRERLGQVGSGRSTVTGGMWLMSQGRNVMIRDSSTIILGKVVSASQRETADLSAVYLYIALTHLCGPL